MKNKVIALAVVSLFLTSLAVAKPFKKAIYECMSPVNKELKIEFQKTCEKLKRKAGIKSKAYKDCAAGIKAKRKAALDKCKSQHP